MPVILTLGQQNHGGQGGKQGCWPLKSRRHSLSSSALAGTAVGPPAYTGLLLGITNYQVPQRSQHQSCMSPEAW